MRTTIRVLAFLVAKLLLSCTQAFQVSRRQFSRAKRLPRLPDLQAEGAQGKSADPRIGQQAATSPINHKTASENSKKVFKQRRWASHPPKGVEKRALTWIRKNQQSASTYDWYDNELLRYERPSRHNVMH
jgi:hypothetical protein